MVSGLNSFLIYLFPKNISYCAVSIEPLHRNRISYMCAQIYSASSKFMFVLLQGSCRRNMDSGINIEKLGLSCICSVQYIHKSAYSNHMQALCQIFLQSCFIHFLGTVSTAYFSQLLIIAKGSQYFLPNI